MGRALDVLCVGEPMVEFSDANANAVDPGFGGDVLNVAVAVARLGGRSGIATRFDQDRSSAAIMRLLENEGVDLQDYGTH